MLPEGASETGVAVRVDGSELLDYAADAESSLRALSSLAERSAVALPHDLARAAMLCSASLRMGGKILACGNGGSAADAAHFVGELVGRMDGDRPSLPALCLAVETGKKISNKRKSS